MNFVFAKNATGLHFNKYANSTTFLRHQVSPRSLVHHKNDTKRANSLSYSFNEFTKVRNIFLLLIFKSC